LEQGGGVHKEEKEKGKFTDERKGGGRKPLLILEGREGEGSAGKGGTFPPVQLMCKKKAGFRGEEQQKREKTILL